MKKTKSSKRVSGKSPCFVPSSASVHSKTAKKYEMAGFVLFAMVLVITIGLILFNNSIVGTYVKAHWSGGQFATNELPISLGGNNAASVILAENISPEVYAEALRASDAAEAGRSGGTQPAGNSSTRTGGNSSTQTTGANGGRVNEPSPGFVNPLGEKNGDLEKFLNSLLDVIILIGTIAVVFSIILAGLKYVTAQGDEKKISSAHTQLTWTVVGAGILLGAKVIAMVVQNTVKSLS